MARKRLRVLLLGGGPPGTALYLMASSREVPRFDAAVFADTGEEPEALYEHLEAIEALGGIPVLRRGDIMLGEAVGTGEAPPIPVWSPSRFGIASHHPACAASKADLAEAVIREEILGLGPVEPVPSGLRVSVSWAVPFDEESRARYIADRWQARSPWIVPEFPLVQRRMTRADVEAWLASHYPELVVPESGCVFCPYHGDSYWLRLRESEPEAWQRAVMIDRSIRRAGLPAFLHRSAKPLEEADLSRSESDLMAIEPDGVCGL